MDGIAPAPRGIPQIEVTFDIDSNGIVHVSAKDLGTGREQHITITASTNLSEEEINKAVEEAKQYAEEDKKKKEEVDLRNQAETAVYSSEKLLKDLGDKVEASEKEEIEKVANELKEKLTNNDLEGIKAKLEELEKHLHKLSEKIYQEAAKAAEQAKSAEGTQPNQENNEGGTTYNADVE